jgi:hypothetical protein
MTNKLKKNRKSNAPKCCVTRTFSVLFPFAQEDTALRSRRYQDVGDIKLNLSTELNADSLEAFDDYY